MDQCINNKHVCYIDKHVLLHNVMTRNSPLMWIIMQPIIGQSINLSLCVCFGKGISAANAWKVSKQWEKPCAMEGNAAEGWPGLWLACHDTQLVKIERCHGCILFTFAFRQY